MLSYLARVLSAWLLLLLCLFAKFEMSSVPPSGPLMLGSVGNDGGQDGNSYVVPRFADCNEAIAFFTSCPDVGLLLLALLSVLTLLSSE